MAFKTKVVSLNEAKTAAPAPVSHPAPEAVRPPKPVAPNYAPTRRDKASASGGMVPQLRFPEFEEAGEWEEYELGKKAEILKGKGIAKADIDPKGSQACIRYGELYTSYGEVISKVVSYTNVHASQLFLSKSNDVIIPSSGETKIDIARASCVMVADVALGSDLNVIRSKINGTFLSYYLNGPKRQEIAKVAQGHTVVHLYRHQLEALTLSVPSPAEQQKIASCLSSVDELIAAQSRKVEALKTYKKGLMQQLFPREGETVPQLRFPEFEEAGEWEERKLGSLASFTSGGTPSKDKSEYWNGSIPWISAASMHDLIVDKSEHYVTLNAVGNGTRIAKKNSILILVRGSILFKRIPICIAGIDVAFNQDVKALELSSGVDVFFVFSQLNAIQKRISISETGIGAGKIDSTQLKELNLFLPSLPEQQKIATCLSAIDAQIALEGRKVEALKAHKRGLMQGLFPAADA